MKKQRFSFTERQLAALAIVWYWSRSGAVVDVHEIANRQGISKTYARQLLNGLVDSGFCLREASYHRSNSVKYFYSINKSHAERIKQNGWLARANECNGMISLAQMRKSDRLLI